VPQQAVQRAPDGHAVAWVLDKSNKAAQRQIIVGEVISHQYVVREGLEARRHAGSGRPRAPATRHRHCTESVEGSGPAVRSAGAAAQQ
jgi:hypothetical protein